MNNNSMLELISIHIPKAAGTSFELTLKDVYGANAVFRINNTVRFRKTAMYEAIKQKGVPQHIKVIHGHSNYDQLKSIINLPENIPVITWLRDPVERTISNFNFRKRLLHEDLKEANVKDKTYRNLRDFERNILEYCSKDDQNNRMSHHLKGVHLEQLLFVGIVEHYTQDLAHLAKLLHWENFQEYKVNISAKHKVDTKIRKIIKRYNKVDYNLYKQALHLRRKRIGILSTKDKIIYSIHRTKYFVQRRLKNRVIYFILKKVNKLK